VKAEQRYKYVSALKSSHIKNTMEYSEKT